jgi:hypothetical protein
MGNAPVKDLLVVSYRGARFDVDVKGGTYRAKVKSYWYLVQEKIGAKANTKLCRHTFATRFIINRDNSSCYYLKLWPENYKIRVSVCLMTRHPDSFKTPQMGRAF